MLRTQRHRHGVPAIRAAALAHGARECRLRARAARRRQGGDRPHRRREAGAWSASTQWADKYGHELSGGMQQRVGLARAFATDADILLMDEPFSALDPLIRDKLQDELLELQKELKKTIIFVSHDLDEAMKLGNRIAILEGGRIVQCGTAEDILLTPAERLRRRIRQAHEPAQRAARRLDDDAGGVACRATAPTSCSTSSGRIRVALDADGRPLSCTLDGDAGALVDGRAATGSARATRRHRRRADRSEDALGDRTAPPLRQPDRARRPARPHGRPLRRRRDLPRAAEGATRRGGCRRRTDRRARQHNTSVDLARRNIYVAP